MLFYLAGSSLVFYW